MALFKEQLFVADTENHLIRRVDLKSKQVVTIAGTGQQATSPFPGFEGTGALPKRFAKAPKSMPLASPWDLWIEKDQLYIAMAGTHQIWKMGLDGKQIGPLAGSGAEDIVDGPFLPKRPFGNDASAFAQPSGLASDGKRLFVADSEGSSIRALPLDEKSPIETLIGTSRMDQRVRLFTFGDVDGVNGIARLQHPLGVAYFQNKLFVADTYNNKVKFIDLSSGLIQTLVGSNKSGATDDPPLLDEPSGLSVAEGKLFIADTNNHQIRVFDLRTSKLSTLKFRGLAAPGKVALAANVSAIPDDAIAVKATGFSYGANATKVDIDVTLVPPRGWKFNEDAPFGYVVQFRRASKGAIVKDVIRQKLKPTGQFSLTAPIHREATVIEVGVTYYYCRADGKGSCYADTVAFEIPIEFVPTAGEVSRQSLRHTIELKPGQE